MHNIKEILTSIEIGDHFRAGKAPLYVTSHSSQRWN